jgi:hypothetical protein
VFYTEIINALSKQKVVKSNFLILYLPAYPSKFVKYYVKYHYFVAKSIFWTPFRHGHAAASANANGSCLLGHAPIVALV